MRILTGPDELTAAAGQHLGYSEWITVEQARIDLFAEATGDYQWIHIDRDRAASGPFGTTIAHGYLTLSLIPMLVSQVYRVDGASMGVNYGCDKVRFPAPVPVGSELRAGVELASVESGALAGSGYRVRSRVTVERAEGDKPACVADVISVVVF